MNDITGSFIWHELRTSDVASSAAFYSRVAGLREVDAQMGGVAHKLLQAAQRPIASIIDTRRDPRDLTGWVGYIGVSDVSESVRRVRRLGGTVLQPERQAPEIGNFAVLADPQGAPFGVFCPANQDEQNNAGTAQAVPWRELYSSNPDAAFEFYADAFGWQKDRAFDMGTAGSYQLFSIGRQPRGGIMKAPPSMGRSVWNPFIRVADIVLAESLVASLNGRVFDGLREVPGGDWTLKCFDPAGSMFALTGRRN